MTHEYVIGVGGHIPGLSGSDPVGSATSIAWAVDTVLAIGRDDQVTAISRGDSTFLDLEGCLVTGPPGAAEDLAPGSRANLDFWDDGHVVARVRNGRFTEGDERRGPFKAADHIQSCPRS